MHRNTVSVGKKEHGKEKPIHATHATGGIGPGMVVVHDAFCGLLRFLCVLLRVYGLIVFRIGYPRW